MADAYQVVLGMIAVSIIVLVPIGFVVAYDALAGRWDQQLQNLKDWLGDGAERRKNLRALRRQQGAPLERLVTDLRRLRLAVSTDEHRSAAHQLGNRLAYDRVLIQICAMLDIEHELDTELSGMDRDIERFRVEADLERAGVTLTDRRYTVRRLDAGPPRVTSRRLPVRGPGCRWTVRDFPAVSVHACGGDLLDRNSSCGDPVTTIDSKPKVSNKK